MAPSIKKTHRVGTRRTRLDLCKFADVVNLAQDNLVKEHYTIGRVAGRPNHKSSAKKRISSKSHILVCG